MAVFDDIIAGIPGAEDVPELKKHARALQQWLIKYCKENDLTPANAMAIVSVLHDTLFAAIVIADDMTKGAQNDAN